MINYITSHHIISYRITSHEICGGHGCAADAGDEGEAGGPGQDPRDGVRRTGSLSLISLSLSLSLSSLSLSLSPSPSLSLSLSLSISLSLSLSLSLSAISLI
jgi:hypothetical protein